MTVTWDQRDFTQAEVSGSVTFAPNANLTDTNDGFQIGQQSKTYHFVNGTGTTDPLVATDNANLSPSGWTYLVTVSLNGIPVYSFNCFINFANGASQKLSSLVPVSPVPSVLAYLPLPSGAASSGQVPVATGSGQASAWTTPLLLDGTAGDIQPTGYAARAGSIGKAADAGHTHVDLYELLAPQGAVAETFPRTTANGGNSALTAQGSLYVVAIPLIAGVPVNNISFGTDTTAAVTVTHGYYALLDNTRKVLGVTADQTSGTWAQTASTEYILPLTATVTPAYTGWYYVGVSVSASTLPSFVQASSMRNPAYQMGSGLDYAGTISGQSTPPTVGTTLGGLAIAGSHIFYAYLS